MKRSKLTAAAIAAVAALSATAASAATAASLDGEQFTNSSYLYDLTSFSCTAAGGVVSFTASGDAEGPYPGTYQATVTLTSGPLDAPNGEQDYRYGQLTSAVETFTITSGATTITGTKTLSAPGGEFICRTYPASECTGITYSATTPDNGVTYAAAGGATDFGTATLYTAGGNSGDSSATDCAGSLYAADGAFSESFTSLAPKAPTTPSECTVEHETKR